MGWCGVAVRGEGRGKSWAPPPKGDGAQLHGTNRYGSGTSAVTLPRLSNSVFEVYSLISMVP